MALDLLPGHFRQHRARQAARHGRQVRHEGPYLVQCIRHGEAAFDARPALAVGQALGLGAAGRREVRLRAERLVRDREACERPGGCGRTGMPCDHAGGRAARVQHRTDRGDDAHIAGAAAQVARQFMADGGLVCVGQAQHDIARGGQHPRRAEAALQRMMPVEGDAQVGHDRVVLVALHRDDVGALAGGGKGDARAHRLVVHQHGAGAAHAVLAAKVGAGQAMRVAQVVAQVRPVRTRAGYPAAVDGEFDGLHGALLSSAVA
ncbi:hypothetical protein D9M68_439040 [compost metagenome]